ARKEPVLASENEPSELAFPSVVGGFDIPVFEKEQQSWPLPVQVAEALSKWRLGRNDRSLTIEPRPKLIEERPTGSSASLTSLLGVVACARRVSLDREQARDDSHALEGDAIAGARGFDQTSSCVRPAPRSLAAGAFEESRDARAIALHGAREIGAEKALHALGVADGRVEEAHPSRVGPSPHRAVANPLRRTGIEHGNAGGVRTEQAGTARLLLNEPRDRREQVERSRDAASERLRRDVNAGTCEARALPLDGQVLDVLVAHRLDDERVGELAALDDLRRRGRRDDGVVVGAGDRLVEPLFDEDTRRDHVEQQAARVADGGHRRAALRADAQLWGNAIEDRHARQMRGRCTAPGMVSSTLLLVVVRRRVVGLRGALHGEATDG